MSEPEQPEAFETPLTIAVISDTHFGDRPRQLQEMVLETLWKSDLILHAGDFCSVEAYDMIASLGELRSVHGNNDALPLLRKLPARRTFQFGKFTAAMIHGHGIGRLTARQAVEREFQGKVDIAIFGHSHQAYREWHDGTLLFNPGSPTQRRWGPSCTFGVIRIGRAIEAELHHLPT